MRKNFGAHPDLFPQPVLMIATYNPDGTVNLMNAVWGGISDTNEIGICLGSHRTTDNILANKEFTVSLANEANIAGCDYVGLVSGNKVTDKVAKAGFTSSKAEFVNAPLINELPVCLECRLKNYDKETGHLFAEIVNINADESVLDENGKIDMEKAALVTFDGFNNNYRGVGKVIAKAFSVGKTIE